MRLIQYANNATSRLASGITNTATSVSLTPGDGSKFPALSGTKFFMGTLVKADGTTEVVKVTARSSDTLTIVRAAESVGGAATAYAFSAGDKFEARLTAEGLMNEIDRLDAAALMGALNKTTDYTVTAADVSSLVRGSTGSGSIIVTLPSIASLTDDFNVVVAKVTGDSNTVTIARSSSDLINGSATYVLTSQYASAWLIADRSTNTWTVMASGGNNGANTIVDSGTGSGSATLALSGDPGSKNNIALYIGSVYQQKADYTLSGTTITAGAAVPAGVKWEAVWSQPLTMGVPADGSVTTAKINDLAVTAAKIAAGAAVSNIGYTPANDTLAMHLAGAETATGAKRGAVSALGNQSGTITLDLATANNFSMTLNANSTNTLANPSNIVAGQSGIIKVSQDATGSRTLAFASYWKFENGSIISLSTTASAVDLLAYFVESATEITVKKLGDRK